MGLNNSEYKTISLLISIFLTLLFLIISISINVNLNSPDLCNKNDICIHNLIIETSNGQEAVEYIPDFQSYYIFFEGSSIGTFLCFENTIIISYKYNIFLI